MIIKLKKQMFVVSTEYVKLWLLAKKQGYDCFYLPTVGAAFYFQNRVSNIGYDNPSFDVSSEQHHQKNTNTDDFSSDDESMLGANTMNNTR